MKSKPFSSVKDVSANDGQQPESPLPPSTSDRPLAGMALMISATLFLAGMDATTKYLSVRYDVPLVMAIRYAIHGALMCVLLLPSQGMKLVETRRTGLVVIRSLCLVVSSLFIGLAFQRMPVAETTAIVFLTPIIVLLVAGRFLHEHIGRFGWAAALFGFAGVVLIIRPGGGLNGSGIAYALVTVAAVTCYQLLSRVLASSERTVTMLFNSALVGALCFGVIAPWFWDGAMVRGLDLVFFFGIGIAGTVGHFLFTAAYRFTAASQLAPIGYLQLVWAVLLGWLVFDHMPDHLTLLGMVIVVISGVMIAVKTRLGMVALPYGSWLRFGRRRHSR